LPSIEAIQKFSFSRTHSKKRNYSGVAAHGERGKKVTIDGDLPCGTLPPTVFLGSRFETQKKCPVHPSMEFEEDA
jgi:hypothetical protein